MSSKKGLINNKSTLTDKNIFHARNTKYITVTYHKLPFDINIKDNIKDIKLQIECNIYNSRKTYKIESITLVKEPYDLDKNPENKDYVHLHGLIVFTKTLRINRQVNTAKLLIFKYINKQYYPHLSPAHNAESYREYINKLGLEDDKYATEEWTATEGSIMLHKDNVIETIYNIHSKLHVYTKQDMRTIIASLDARAWLKHRQSFACMMNMLPESKQKVEDYILSTTGFLHNAQAYNNNPNYELVKKALADVIDIPRKYCAHIIGAPNLGKTSMIRAAIAELEQENSSKYLILKIGDLDDAKIVNRVNKNDYDYILMLFDDAAPEGDNKKSRTYIINLLTGNELTSTIKCRYENAIMHDKIIKIFTHNVSFDKMITEMRKEYKVRIRECQLDDLYTYKND
jgi:hypothetical protein